MKRLCSKRILSLLLVICLIAGMIPVIAPVEAEAVSGIENLTCSSFISNSWHRTYIDTMMKHYLNSYSKLTTALDNGKNVIFMFEGGSDNYPSNTYEDSAYDTRTQSVVIVVKKNSSGQAYIAFSCENCSSLPDDPDDCTGAAYSGATTLMDGIHAIQTVNHTGPYGALNCMTYTGYYTPPASQNGYTNGASGINIHTRTSAGSGGGWSLGCQVIGYGNSSANEFNAFMKAVTGITYNVWVTYKSALYTITAYQDMGYYVLDRQLGCENASGTHYGSGSLIEMYNSTALTNITAWSTAERAKANFGYLSSCTPYASHCEIEVTEETPVNTLPCSLGTDDECTTVETAMSGDVYTATKIYKNTYGNYWYEVITKSGDTGYIYGGSVKYLRQLTSDITLTGASFPNGHVSGNTFVVSGTIKSSYNQLTKASVYVYSGFGTSGTQVTGYTDSVSGNSYTLANSTIDYNTAFNSVPLGKNTYYVSAEYINYYTDGATTLKSNTGTVELAQKYFVTVSSSTSQSTCSHSNSTTVIKGATCTASGISVESCSTCGLVTEKTVAATGHAYSNWVVVNPTCTVDGSRTRTCSNCGDTEKQTITASHQYNLKEHDATCKDYKIYEYTCGVCGDNYKLNAGTMTTQWLDVIPEGMDPSLFKTKTQYRYSDCTSTTWKQSGSGTIKYVDTWASGFDTTSSVYTQYNKKDSRVTASETETAKTVINYDKKIGYLWYHWCDTTKTSSWAYETDPYHTFHTYYDTVDPSNYPVDTSDYSYGTAHSSCSNATYWFPMDVYEQSYTTYTAQPDGKQWGDWSAWSDTVYTPVDNSRKVETRTVYQLKAASLGDHNWSEGVCSICGLECEHVCVDDICTICGMYIPSQTYYLFGFINGADYGCEGDYENLGEYLFEDGKLTAVFREDSYVAVKTGDNLNWYMTNGYLGETTSATLYSTATSNMVFDKLFVPKGHDITFTLVDNKDGTFNLSYTAVACPHQNHSVDGVCLHCGISVEHTFVDGFCACGEEEPKITDYYLFGYINGADYACEGDYANIGIYKFVDGKLVVTFQQDSYVGVKTGDNNTWYMTDGWLGYDVTSAKLSNTTALAYADKLYVPGGVEITFTLVVNEADDTLLLSYVAAEPDVILPSISLKYPTLSFEDEILMNVYFSASELTDVEQMGLITYSSNVSVWNVNNAEAVVPGYTFSSEAGLYYATTEGIAAKCLGDTIYFAVYAKLSDGSYHYTKLVSYSPKTYAYAQLSSGSAEMKPLVVAMLNYGAAAQTYFGYNTSNLVNNGLTDSEKALVQSYSASMMNAVAPVDSSKVGIFTNSGGFSKKYPTVSFEGAFCINYYFTPSGVPSGKLKMFYWTQEDYNAVATLTPGNATGYVFMEDDGTGVHHAVVEGIAAKDLDGTIYISAGYVGEGTTTSYCTGVLAYSIGSYCVQQAATGGSQQALAQATAVYGYYAKELFYQAA